MVTVEILLISLSVDNDYTNWALFGSGVFQVARVPACRGFCLAPKSLSTAQIYPLEGERKDLYL